jgi:Phosphotransferase enzyme family
VWSSGQGICAPGEIICHGDFGPWNTVWRDGDIAGLIGWDHARPAPPLFDVAYALEYAAPFRDNEECVRRLRYPAPPDRRRIEVFCDAYGIAVPADIGALVAKQQRGPRPRHRAAGHLGPRRPPGPAPGPHRLDRSQRPVTNSRGRSAQLA